MNETQPHTQTTPAAPIGSHHEAAGRAPADLPQASAGAQSPVAVSFVSQAAMEMVLAMRVRQMEKFGHTPDSDMARPIADLIATTAPFMRYLREDASCGASLDAIEKHAAALGAMALAIIDRVQGERELRHG